MAARKKITGFRSIQTSMMVIGLLVIIINAVTLSLTNYFQLQGLGNDVEESITASVDSDINHITQSLLGQISAQDQMLRQQIQIDLNLAEHLIQQGGGIVVLDEQGGKIATNQLTNETINVSLPVIALGSVPIPQNSNPMIPSPVVDTVHELTGDVATIYQVMNKKGDLLTVATTIKKAGQRAVGSFIPAMEAGGVPNPVVEAIMKGETYTGVSFVVDDWYLSMYKPLLDPSGTVIGAISIGVKQENNTVLRNTIQKLKVGETGYAFILGGKGERMAKYIIPPDESLNGVSLAGVLSQEGLDLGREMVDRTIQLGEEELGQFEYIPLMEDGSITGKQVVNLAYYAPWDWIIGVSVPEEEIKEAVSEVQRNRNTILLTGILIALVAIVLTGLGFNYFAKSITKPIKALQKNAEILSTGDLSVDMRISNTNEIGLLSNSLQDSVVYLQSMAREAERIASGDLTSQIQPRSERDLLGVSFNEMIQNLKNQVQNITASTEKLDQAALSLMANSNQAAEATSQIATTIQQVAHGTSQQTESITRTASGVEQLVRAIDGVAQGAQEQAGAVAKAAEITNQISKTIGEVAQRIHRAEDYSSQAAGAATNGSEVVDQTLEGMQVIKQKVETTDQKMRVMEDRSNQIGEIVSTIEDIASQTNLLALNAAIEAARAETQADELIEFLLNRQMVSQAQLVNQLLTDNDRRPETFWSELARSSGLDVISVANEDGTNVSSSDPRLVGFRYSEDPKEQSYAFRKIIHSKDGVVCQPPKKRSIDGLLYKYIGISRRDKPGVIQVGFNAESLSKFSLQVGGFAVVATEVYRLAENSKTSAKNIAQLIREIRKSMNEAIKAMKESSEEVDNGYAKAEKANQALMDILKATEEVSVQAAEAASAAEQMNQYADQLVMAVDSVSAVVEENTAATEEMAASSGEVNQAIENIASVSEENSAAVEEVSASTEEMKAQVEMVTRAAKELQEMSETLKSVISEFKITSD